MDSPDAGSVAGTQPVGVVTQNHLQAESAAEPAVTVLMAVHNGEKFLENAIRSILSQSFGHFEIVIVDDASSDRSAEILASYDDPRIRILTNPTNVGLTKSLNIGLAASRARLIARLDADDLAQPERLAAQVEFMNDHPEIPLVGTRVILIDSDGKRRGSAADLRATSSLAIRWQLIFGNPFAHSSVMFRKDVIHTEMNGYDERFVYNQDFELWSRLLRRYDAANIPQALVCYRVHNDSIAGRRGPEYLESRMVNLRRNIGVQRANVEHLLALAGVDDPSLVDEWPEVWTAINVEWLMGEAPRPDRAVALVDRLRSAFDKAYPAALADPEIDRQMAQTLMTIGRYLASRRTGAAFRAFWRARAVDSESTWAGVLPFAAALVTRMIPMALKRRALIVQQQLRTR